MTMVMVMVVRTAMIIFKLAVDDDDDDEYDDDDGDDGHGGLQRGLMQPAQT